LPNIPSWKLDVGFINRWAFYWSAWLKRIWLSGTTMKKKKEKKKKRSPEIWR